MIARFLTALLLVVAACGADEIDPLGFEPGERGPMNVGFRSWDVTYVPAATGDERTVTMHMWYPTDETGGNNPAYENLFRDDDVFEDAPPAGPIHDGGYPVLVHSHGHRGYAGNSSDIMAHVASHGWVAIAPNHTDNTLFEDEPYPTSHYYERTADISRALDELASVDLPGTPLADRALMTGHSFGTFTTWIVSGAAFDETEVRARCESGDVPCTEDDIQTLMGGLRDDRVIASIPMAGGDRGWFGTSGYDAVGIPVLLMTGSDDDVGAAALFDMVQMDLTWIDVAGGCHQLFGLGGCDEIDDATGFGIVNTFVMAFGRRWILDDESMTGILDGTEPVSDHVALKRK